VGSFSEVPADLSGFLGLRAAVGVGAVGVLNKNDLKTRERYSNRGELPGLGGSEREDFVRQAVGLPG
jgi:hypothetical protein